MDKIHRSPWFLTRSTSFDFKSLGYRLVFDYQKDQLGSQDSTTNGMIQVEGAWYCPSMPQNLIDATKHYWFGDPANLDEVTKKPIKLTEDEYRQRIDDRRPYLVRLKDGNGTDDRWHCPSSGNKPLAMCERKPDSLVNAQGKRRIFPVVIENNEAPALCQQGSVSLAKHTGAKFRQDLHYGSDEWHGVYSTLRNTIEGENVVLKNGCLEGLGDSRRRPIRGIAAATLLTAVLIWASNIRRIRNHFTNAEPSENHDVPVRPRRAPRPRTGWENGRRRQVKRPDNPAPPPEALVFT